MDDDEKVSGLDVVSEKEDKISEKYLPEGLQHGTREKTVCQHLLTAKRAEARWLSLTSPIQ